MPEDGADERSREQSEPDDPQVAEHLERDAVRLGRLRRVDSVPQPGDRVRSGARAAERPVPRDVERLLPPGDAVVGAQVGEPAGSVGALTARELRRRPGERVADLCHQPDRTAHEHDRARDDQHRPNEPLALAHEASDGELPRRDRDSERHEQGQHGEDPAVRDPVGAQHPVVDESGSCERPGADREAGACEDDQPEGVDQPLPAQHEPEDDDRDGTHDPCP